MIAHTDPYTVVTAWLGGLVAGLALLAVVTVQGARERRERDRDSARASRYREGER